MMTQTRSSLCQHVKLILACLASVGTVNSASAAEASYRAIFEAAVKRSMAAQEPLHKDYESEMEGASGSRPLFGR